MTGGWRLGSFLFLFQGAKNIDSDSGGRKTTDQQNDLKTGSQQKIVRHAGFFPPSGGIKFCQKTHLKA